jgi:hypothetical protein
VFASSHVDILSVDPLATGRFTALPRNVDCPSKDRQEVTGDASAGQDQALYASVREEMVVAREAGFSDELIEHLEKKLLRELVLFQGYVEVDVIAVVPEFQTDWRVPMVVPVGAVTDRSGLQPDGSSLHNPMKVVEDVSLVPAGNVV